MKFSPPLPQQRFFLYQIISILLGCMGTVLILIGIFRPTISEPHSILDRVKDRGKLICGVNDGQPRFSELNAEGVMIGFDADFCKAIAVAIFGEVDNIDAIISYEDATAANRFKMVSNREVDILIRHTTHTLRRDVLADVDFAYPILYDAQKIMVKHDGPLQDVKTKKELADKLLQQNDFKICVLKGGENSFPTTTYLNLETFVAEFNLEKMVEIQYSEKTIDGEKVWTDNSEVWRFYNSEKECDAWSSDELQLITYREKLNKQDQENHHIIPKNKALSEEPLAPVTLENDSKWRDFVNTVIWGLVVAEEMQISKKDFPIIENKTEIIHSNILSRTATTKDRILLGIGNDDKSKEISEYFGLEADFMRAVIQEVGNYGEIYDRYFSDLKEIDRGQNHIAPKGKIKTPSL